MIQIYENWYQLTDNNWWGRKLPGHYDAAAFRRLCMGRTFAVIAPDMDTILMCNDWAGYKLRLSQHNLKDQNDIIDTLIPFLR